MRQIAIVALAALALCAGAPSSKAQTGHASWYGHEMCRKGMSCRTANGERFNPAGLTAAHRTWKFGTRVKVKNLANGKTVIVRINDRGPFVKGRVIDLSHGAAKAIGLGGVGLVQMTIVK